MQRTVTTSNVHFPVHSQNWTQVVAYTFIPSRSNVRKKTAADHLSWPRPSWLALTDAWPRRLQTIAPEVRFCKSFYGCPHVWNNNGIWIVTEGERCISVLGQPGISVPPQSKIPRLKVSYALYAISRSLFFFLRCFPSVWSAVSRFFFFNLRVIFLLWVF